MILDSVNNKSQGFPHSRGNPWLKWTKAPVAGFGPFAFNIEQGICLLFSQTLSGLFIFPRDLPKASAALLGILFHPGRPRLL